MAGFRSLEDYISKYRRVLDYFDAVKVGLTATPALHTTQIFGAPTASGEDVSLKPLEDAVGRLGKIASVEASYAFTGCAPLCNPLKSHDI